MSVTPNLDITLLEENSDQPEVVVNDALVALDDKITGKVTVLVSTSNTVAFTQDQQAAGSIFEFDAGSPGPSAAITASFAAFGMGVFAVINNSGFPITLQIAGQPITPPVLPAGLVGVFFSDGVNVIAAAGSSIVGGGIIASLVASEALSAGDLINIHTDSGAAKLQKADATDDTKPADGFVLAAVLSGAIGVYYGPGQLDNKRSALTAGALYYLGTTGGGITVTPPSSSGNLVQEIGRALSATTLAFAPKAGVTL